MFVIKVCIKGLVTVYRTRFEEREERLSLSTLNFVKCKHITISTYDYNPILSG